MASNFAPGTTSADIESAMVPIGGEMQSCRIMSSSPTVIAEMVFVDKKGADAVIETFNNQKVELLQLAVHLVADSRPLRLMADCFMCTQNQDRLPIQAPFQLLYPKLPLTALPELDRQHQQSRAMPTTTLSRENEQIGTGGLQNPKFRTGALDSQKRKTPWI